MRNFKINSSFGLPVCEFLDRHFVSEPQDVFFFGNTTSLKERLKRSAPAVDPCFDFYSLSYCYVEAILKLKFTLTTRLQLKCVSVYVRGHMNGINCNFDVELSKRVFVK
jgi:hypothetical protein